VCSSFDSGRSATSSTPFRWPRLARRCLPPRIDWLVGEKHRPILDLVPVIDRRVVLADGLSLATLSSIRRVEAESLRCRHRSSRADQIRVLARSSGAGRHRRLHVAISERTAGENLLTDFTTGGDGITRRAKNDTWCRSIWACSRRSIFGRTAGVPARAFDLAAGRVKAQLELRPFPPEYRRLEHARLICTRVVFRSARRCRPLPVVEIV